MSFVIVTENEKEVDDWKEYYINKCDELYIWKPHNWHGYYKPDTVMDRTKARTCGRAGKGYTIRANGDVTPCCWDFNREASLGNINENTFEEIVNGERNKNFIKIHRDGSFFEDENICRNCDQLYDRLDALVYSSVNNFKVGMSIMDKNKY